MFKIASLAVLTFSFLALTARADAPATAPAAQTLTGVLHGGMMGIGGETTGWNLTQGETVTEVDVSAVGAQAEKLDGRRVTLTGSWIIKKYVERGDVKVFVATDIAATPN